MIGCRQKCWIAGGAAGLLVALALLSGGASLATAVLMGAVTVGLLGGLLVWGLCEGRGSAAENAEIHALTWEPEPFTPSRRVVAPGGRVVSTTPLEDEAPLPAAPLESVTLQASRNLDRAKLVPVEPQDSAGSEDPPPPSETVAALATPAVASVIPVAPIATEVAVAPIEAAAVARPRSPLAARVVEDLGDDRVATITDAAPAAADDLRRIDGIGPMIAGWLAENGVTRLDQIAAWDDADISHFAIMMGRNGHRIRAEDWVGQARALVGTSAGGLA